MTPNMGTLLRNSRTNGLIWALALFGLCLAAQPSRSDPLTPAGGPKKSIAVGGFEAAELVAGGATPDQLSALLVNALIKDGRFIVVERTALAQLQIELELGRSGATSAGTAPATGRLMGVQVIVRGTVTKFEAGASGGDLSVGGFNFLGGGGAGVAGQTAVCEISLRMIDAVTGQITFVTTAKGSASARSVQLTGPDHGVSWAGGAFMKTPLGQALQDAIEKGVIQIADAVMRLPWSAMVIESDGAKVYITAGADQNMQPGMTLHVYRPGRTLTDPATGVVLDTTMEDVATLRIQTVRDKVSIAVVTVGGLPVRGDVVKLN